MNSFETNHFPCPINWDYTLTGRKTNTVCRGVPVPDLQYEEPLGTIHDMIRVTIKVEKWLTPV